MLKTTAFDVLTKENNENCLGSDSEEFNKAIGRGLQPGIVTEFTGGPGTAKTQMW